jgi:flagellar biosynthesis protein FliR
MTMNIDKVLSWTMLVIGIVGFLVSFPLWLMNKIDDRQMLGLTLVLSWAALWYSAYIAIKEANRTDNE